MQAHPNSGGRRSWLWYSKNEIREFLAPGGQNHPQSRAGYLARRRVPACAAKKSPCSPGSATDYYAQLERGNLSGVSDSVLDPSPAPCNSTKPKRAFA